MDNKAQTVSTHREIPITINGDNFAATIEKCKLESPTLVGIREKIDTYLKNQSVKDREKLAIPAITDKGKTVTITGLHARVGSILTTPSAKDDRYGGNPDFYPDHAHARRLLREFAIAKQTVEVLEKKLSGIEIKVSHRYGEVKADEYEGLMGELKRNAATALKNCESAAAE